MQHGRVSVNVRVRVMVRVKGQVLGHWYNVDMQRCRCVDVQQVRVRIMVWLRVSSKHVHRVRA